MAPKEVADQEVAVTAEMLEEARRYRTVQTLLKWPVITNTTSTVLDGYHSLKEGDVARVVLNASEELVGIFCQSVVLPVARTWLVRTPLNMADYVGSGGTALLQKAMPQLTDTKHPVKLNADLLVSLLLVPLTLTVALSRDLLQAVVDRLVTAFPALQPATEGFEEKTVVGQCLTLALMVGLYLPLLLLSQPVQTVRQLVAVPFQVAADALVWLRQTAAALVTAAAGWARWLAGEVRQYVIQAVAVVAATAQTAYYVMFVMTGLQPLLERLLKWARSLLERTQDGARNLISTASEAAPVRGLADSITNSELAPVQLARQLWCGGSEPAEADRRPAEDASKASS